MKRAVILAILYMSSASCGRFLEPAVVSPAVEGEVVTFRFHSPGARTVQVAGDFNNWARGDAEAGEVLVGLMERDDRGVWILKVTLEPGRYRYVFIVDERTRVLDPVNPRVAGDGRGGKANLLIKP